jgi:stage II sporulation protein D
MFIKSIALSLACLSLATTALLSGGTAKPVPYTAFNKNKNASLPTVRVLLTNDQPGLVLEIKGKYRIFDPRTNQQLSRGFQGKRRMLQTGAEGIIWGETFPGVYQLNIVPEDSSTTITLDDVAYPGTLYFYDIGGTISAVNAISVEEYLKATLATHYRDPLPDELLAALAITARTSTYHSAQHNRSPFWDIDAAEVGYQGHQRLQPSPEMARAIDHTKFMILHRSAANGEWSGNPFAVEWRPGSGAPLLPDTTYSAITIEEAAQMAKRGNDASKILEKAFPGTSLQLIRRD